MIVLPYKEYSHKSGMITMLEARHMDTTLWLDLPSFGLIAHEDGKVVAAGFLRRVEGGYAMLDSYITNPHATSDQRNRALDTITSKLISISNAHGVTKLFTFTLDQGIADRAVRLGLTHLAEYSLLVKTSA